jgi:DNA-binding IclR family transcriptional regulator
MPRRPAPDGRYAAPALEKGLDILELLAGEQGGLTQNEIAQRLGRSASQLFRMLEALLRRGWIVRSPRDGRYALSLRVFELGHRHPPTRRLLEAALPEMRALADATAQSVHLAVLHAARLLVVAQVESPAPMGFAVRLGAHFAFRPDRVSPHVLTAFQPPERRAQLMAELATGLGAPARARLGRILDAIARNGVYVVPSATARGVTDIAAPVRDASGAAIAALAMPHLALVDSPQPIAACRDAVRECALRISRRLGLAG